MNHDELAFLAEVSGTNHEIALYIARVLDIDGGRTEFSTPLRDVEFLLADRLLAIGQALHASATGRVDLGIAFNVSAIYGGLDTT